MWLFLEATYVRPGHENLHIRTPFPHVIWTKSIFSVYLCQPEQIIAPYEHIYTVEYQYNEILGTSEINML